MATIGDKDLAKQAKDKGYDLFSKGDLNALVQNFADNAVFVAVPTGETFRGRNEIMNFMSNFKTAFPDMKLDIDRQIACGDQVVTEFVAKGTHKGVFKTPMGDIPPTNRKVDLPLCEVVRMVNGKFVENHLYFDSAALMNQLGVINLPEESHKY